MLKTIFFRIRQKVRTILNANNKRWPPHNYVYSTNKSEIGSVDFNFIKKIPEQSEKLLIDVRTITEVIETGRIPGSINIPLDDLCKNLGPSTSPVEFSYLFGRLKPSKTTQLIFTCRSGKRAQVSAQKAKQIGYTNVWVYEGSWIDWQKRMNETKKICE